MMSFFSLSGTFSNKWQVFPFILICGIGTRSQCNLNNVEWPHKPFRTRSSAPFVKCDNKTDRLLEPVYVVFLPIFVTGGFNESSTSTAMRK